LQLIYDELYEQYLDEIFGTQSKLSKNEFIELMKGKGKQWLQPHYLRQLVFKNIFEKLAEAK
jgi:hypothetical protein